MSVAYTTIKRFFQNRKNRWCKGSEIAHRFPSITAEKLLELHKQGKLNRRNYKNNTEFKLKR